MSTYLGVDGGGTKTALALLRGDGELLAHVSVRSCYYLGGGATTGAGEPAGVELVAEVLAEGVYAVCATAGVAREDIDHAFVGLPGYGEVGADLPALDAAPRRVLGHDRYRCANDVVCGWAGSLGGADGVHVVAGTGSIAYGRRGAAGVRVGGWGEVFGDEGSAYAIAVAGLRAFSRMSDGRLPAGPLAALLREHLRLDADLDLVDLVLVRWGGDRARIAALSRVVTAAAGQGDASARAIVEEAAGELAGLVVAADARLGARDADAPLPVSYSGGVFTAGAVRAAFARHLAALGARRGGFDVRAPLFPPVVGAALRAAALAGEPLDAAAQQRLRAALAGGAVSILTPDLPGT